MDQGRGENAGGSGTVAGIALASVRPPESRPLFCKERCTGALLRFAGAAVLVRSPSCSSRAGFVEVSEARSDWAPDPNHPLPKFSPPRRVPHGVTLIGRLFDEGRLIEAELALEREFAVAGERPAGF
jgi:hypothetical protein